MAGRQQQPLFIQPVKKIALGRHALFRDPFGGDLVFQMSGILLLVVQDSAPDSLEAIRLGQRAAAIQRFPKRDPCDLGAVFLFVRMYR